MTQSHDPDALIARLRQVLPAETLAALDRILATAHSKRPVYAVGGTVRDLLLDRALVDLDLAVEGDGIALMRHALPAIHITTHSRFATATVRIGGLRIDVAATRTESYARPGALPAIQPASIDDDLYRRDFSVNALALRLDGPPRLLDPCGGLADFASRIIRVLHDRSFIDDATRIFRALRYAARLGFTLEPETARLLREGLPYMATIGGERLRRELELMLGEREAAGPALEAAHAVGALQAVHPALHWNDAKSIALTRSRELRVPLLPFGFALLACGASAVDGEAIVRRLKLKRAEADAVAGITAVDAVAEMLRRPAAKPSGVALMLDRFPPSSIAAFALTTGSAIAREIALRYLAEWRHAKPLLNGDDILEMGIPPGPHVKQALQLVRAARLDGWANDRDGERALVARFAKSISDSSTMTATLDLDLDDA